jgi:pilus assembly protein CpaF
MELPLVAIREQIASAVNIVVQLARFSCGTRCVSAIAEVTGTESGRIQMQDLFRFHRLGASNGRVLGEFRACGNDPHFYESLPATERPGVVC